MISRQWGIEGDIGGDRFPMNLLTVRGGDSDGSDRGDRIGGRM